MKYKTLLFDLDGTLLDFDLAQERALQKVLQKYIKRSDIEILKKYQEINSKLWRELDEGKITMQQLFATRFKMVFTTYQIPCDTILANKVNQEYLDNLTTTCTTRAEEIWITGAEEICKKLAKKHDIYIVTNGTIKTQTEKIKKMGLQQYVKGVFISEEIGRSKPKREYFEFVFSKIGITDLSSVLMIGDRLSSDIKGGNNAGIDTCWYNPKQKPREQEVLVTYEIQNLSELLDIV